MSNITDKISKHLEPLGFMGVIYCDGADVRFFEFREEGMDGWTIGAYTSLREETDLLQSKKTRLQAEIRALEKAQKDTRAALRQLAKVNGLVATDQEANNDVQ